MLDTIKLVASRLGPTLLTCLPTLALLGTLSWAQADQRQSQNPAPAVDDGKGTDSIAKAGADTPESIYYVEEIAKQGQVEAVPMLEKKFLRTQDETDKEHIASALVRLGDKKDVYWDFLIKQATVAIESAIPDFIGYDSEGKVIGGPSPGFTAWAQAHNLSVDAAEERDRVAIGAVMWLGITMDPRGTSLLRQGLSARNYLIQAAAADGLAAIQDTGSIPLIIDACKRAPAETGAVIAQSLAYFDDREAQSALDKYVPKDMAKALRERRAEGKKTPWD